MRVLGDARGVFRRLLRHVRVERRAARGRPGRDGGHRLRIDGAHAVHGRANARDRIVSHARRECVDAYAPAFGIAVTEPALRADELSARPVAAQVTRVEQREPDPGFRRRRDDHGAHLIRLRVRPAVNIMVQVVELPHQRDPCERHLRERAARERQVPVGVEAFGEGVHLRAPRPEVVGPARATASYRATPGGTRASARWRIPEASRP